MNHRPNTHPDEAARAAAWEADRQQEATHLPYSHVRHYSDPGERQIDLAAAERTNIARAAGELGLTSGEWSEMRSKLGRSPSRGDVNRR